MTIAQENDLQAYCLETAKRARRAAEALVTVSAETKNAWLREAATQLRGREADLLAANALDLEAAPGFGLERCPGRSAPPDE